MRALVTEATRTVGFEICGALRRLGIEAHPFDHANRAPETVDALCLAAPSPDVERSRLALQAALDRGARTVVLVSSRAADWDDRTEAGGLLRDVEELVKASEARWTILRASPTFQIFITNHADSIRDMSAIVLPQGDGLVSYVDALDVADVAATCVAEPDSHHGRTYVLTGGRAYGVKGVAAEIGRMVGRPITYIGVEEDQARDMMLEAGIPPQEVEARLAVLANARAGGEAAVDPALARLLGRPATTLSEFVERNRDAWD